MLSWLACQLRQLSFCCYLTKNSPRSFSWEFCRQWSRLFTKNKTNPSLAPRSFQEQSEVENSAQRLHLFSLSCPSFHICQRGGGRGARLFPLTPLSSLPFQARHLPCLCPRTPWTRTDTKKPPRHGRPRCPLLSQKLARATEELPCSREARPLIHILRMAACSPITYTISQLH